MFEDIEIITQDEELLTILKTAEMIAPSSATILIQGESGTGKELLASYIHKKSGRKGLYVPLNCASIPENLVETELFGYEKGAFTGAFKQKIGKVELANTGTLVLDEINELTPSIQSKLLRCLQEKKVDRVGGYRPIPVDFRLIAISNIGLKKLVMENRFRKDLYFRLNVIPFIIPPLRERKRDINLLVKYFMTRVIQKNNLTQTVIDEETLKLLNNYNWEGNVRELENVIERAVLLSQKEDKINNKYFYIEINEENNDNVNENLKTNNLKNIEKELIYKTLKDVNENRTQAAKALGISIRTLRNKLKEYNLAQGICLPVSS